MSNRTAHAPFRLAAGDVERYARLRRRMLDDSPWAFSASPEDDRALDLAALKEQLGEQEFAIVGVEATPGGELAAVTGVVRARERKFAHRAIIWGVFVAPEHRGRGLGRAVMTAAIDLARSWPGVDYVDLAVSVRSPEAQA